MTTPHHPTGHNEQGHDHHGQGGFPEHGHHHHHHQDHPPDDCAVGVHAFPLTIGGKHVKVSGPTATGLELKLLGEVPEGNDLFLVVPGGRDEGVPDHHRVELKDCQVFYDLPPSNLGGGLV